MITIGVNTEISVRNPAVSGTDGAERIGDNGDSQDDVIPDPYRIRMDLIGHTARMGNAVGGQFIARARVVGRPRVSRGRHYKTPIF